MPAISFLECSRCHQHFSAATPQTVCLACAGTLYVRYDMQALRKTANRPGPGSISSMWRYADVLPDIDPVTLGEGWTPMLQSRRYPALFVKEEGTNPTGSFKARGMSVAVSMARHYGLNKLTTFSTGSASSALAACAAAAGIEAHVVMPRDVPMADNIQSRLCGARVSLVDGPISDGAGMIAERKAGEGWFDVSSLREPFRLEGDKTMGYELVEQLGWMYPDAVIGPTRTGLIGMWKAFDEMEQLGWVSGKRPKMIAARASGCASFARSGNAEPLMLEIVRESGGTVVDLPDEQILASLHDWARHEGLFLCPEGATATAACNQLIAGGYLNPEDRVVLFNTASGLKSIDAVAEAMHWKRPAARQYPQRTPVGGIITPQ